MSAAEMVVFGDDDFGERLGLGRGGELRLGGCAPRWVILSVDLRLDELVAVIRMTIKPPLQVNHSRSC